MLVKVTKEILERSKMCGYDTREIVSSCAIAEAVREIWPLATVGWSRFPRYAISPFGFKEGTEILLPDDAKQFIRLFDRTMMGDRPNLPEFSFEIEVPQEVIDKIGIEEVTRILSESKTLELVGETIGEN